MTISPQFEFHVSRTARDLYRFDDALFGLSGNVVFADLAAGREFARRMNLAREAEQHPERAVHPGALNAMGLIDEALHALLALYRQRYDPPALTQGLEWFELRLGREALDRVLLSFADHFPAVAVYRGQQTAAAWLAQSTGGVPHRAVALEELILLWLANLNPAFRPFSELFDDQALAAATAYSDLAAGLRDYFQTRPRFEGQNLVDMLRAPALASPSSLAGQIAFIRDQWGDLLGDFVRRLLLAMDVLQEEEVAIWMRFHPPLGPFGGGAAFGDSSAAVIPHFAGMEHEGERFSPDVDWMARTVMIAKSVHVWLHQLSRAYGRHIHSLDQVPDEELDLLARRGFNALWLIGVWERSPASRRIKHMMGNPEAAGSAYSLYDYTIAQDLGGEPALANLRERAAGRGIRLASDMVPNHMGVDSRWVIEHPDWFLSLPYSPFPAYRFEGPDLSHDGRAEIKIEDHYYDHRDAAVVFRRLDRRSGEARYIYHGNDGTTFPWNDTAQLDYLKPEVREGLIQTILHVARQFPIIRFDAAMTLTKQHYHRLWYPAPGTGGAIPSRAEHGLTKAQFDAAMPTEFWREVVDRVATEVPGTLLLAEAFWLLEGYFVRTLGMHRVYNSAFMNMLRDEENANYRRVIRNTLEFDPDVLKRYVNFMSNPDERTASDQFGGGDKYFGVATLMATLPGLPMFGHGQIEGFTERYGMEYRRAYYEETPDPWLVSRHERDITPLLHRRPLFAGVEEFLLYDFYTDEGWVNEDVFAYSNRLGNDRALIVYHNRYANTQGWIRVSCGYAEKLPGGARRIRQRTLGETLGLSAGPEMLVAFRDAFTGQEYLHRSRDLAEKGLHLELGAYRCHAFLDWKDIRDDGARPWGELCSERAGRGVSSLEDALRVLELRPVHDALRALLDPAVAEQLARQAATPVPAQASGHGPEAIEQAGDRLRRLLTAAQHYASSPGGHAAGLGPSLPWGGELELSLQTFRQNLQRALRIPPLERHFAEAWPADARSVLPNSAASPDQATRIWAAILAWAALDALARFQDPADPGHAAARLFDALRLREPTAEAFLASGFAGEERWRAAARVRAGVVHQAWAPGRGPLPARHPDVFSWSHDPDVAWLLGVHEDQGARYFVKEPYEQLLWWMALPALLAALDQPDVAPGLRLLESELRQRMRTAAEGGYLVEVLLESRQPPPDKQ